MENPATWTPLHWEIHNAFYHTIDGATSILKVLHAHNYRVTLDQVQAVINRHNENEQLQIAGLSLPSMIVNALAQIEG
jgi:hypothetical protein